MTAASADPSGIFPNAMLGPFALGGYPRVVGYLTTDRFLTFSDLKIPAEAGIISSDITALKQSALKSPRERGGQHFWGVNGGYV